MNWHLFTGEYPPQPGGVSDHTFLVAHGLADAGHRVSVWCPPADATTPGDGSVFVRRELGTVSRADLRRVGVLLDAEPAPRRLLIQWVPHAYGRRAINYPFCRWVSQRAVRHGDRVEVLVHEPFLDFRGSWKQRAAAVVQRLMMRSLLRAAVRVWVTIPAWEELIRPFAASGLPIDLLPVPSNIPVVDWPAQTHAVRERYLDRGEVLLGHFGTYGGHVRDELFEVLVRLLGSRSQLSVLLLGRNSDQFRDKLLQTVPEAMGRVAASGGQSAVDLSVHIAACDLFVQPYIGGISSRNGSLMACLAHGRPVVANSGRLTESWWHTAGAVVLTQEHDADEMCAAVNGLVIDRDTRTRMAAAATDLYEERFSLSRSISRLTGTELAPTP